MNVTCPSCETVYRVDPSKVPAGGVRARCAVCSNVFPVNAASATAQRSLAEPGPPPAAVAAAQRAPAAPGGPGSAPRPPAPPAAPAPPAPAPAPPRAPAMPRFSGPIAAPTSAPAPPAAPPRAAPPPAPRAVPAPAPPPAAPAMRPAAPSAAPAPRAAPPPAPRAPAAPAAPPPPAAPAGAAPGQRMSGPLRPVNPFMVQDPKQKARRLARALVSDLVVYHPEKRQQGLRDGTLPQLFKDEIEKSWQEYVEQVGVELAKSTPFWTEALNEILAGGNKVF